MRPPTPEEQFFVAAALGDDVVRTGVTKNLPGNLLAQWRFRYGTVVPVVIHRFAEADEDQFYFPSELLLDDAADLFGRRGIDSDCLAVALISIQQQGQRCVAILAEWDNAVKRARGVRV